MAKRPYIVGAVVALIVVAAVALSWMVGRTGFEKMDYEPEKHVTRPETPSEPSRPKEVFDSPLAGRWYPANPDELTSVIEKYLAAAEQEPLENVQALILPHAGYQYSGPTAAYGLKAVHDQQYSRVVIMGPSHRVPIRGYASVPDATHYRTPLGEIPLDVAFIDALLEYRMVRHVAEAHAAEHSVQIEVPLVQHVLGPVPIVPIVVGQLALDEAREMARILGGVLDEETLVIVSSDFTHYGRGYGYVPFDRDVPENLERLDMAAWNAIESRKPETFDAWLNETHATICGSCPILILLSMLPETSEAHLLNYQTSGALTNDYTNSVSYLSIAFTGPWRKGSAMNEPAAALPLTQEDKDCLLRLARETLRTYIETGKTPAPEQLGIEITPAMKQVMGAFVTLHKHGRLRGCIGEIEPRRPLYQAVMDNAINAGAKDFRFQSVTLDEIPELEFEISALTPPHPVGGPEHIVIGKHGMTIEKAGRRAVFLPQVAPEQGWDRDTTLNHLCMKAGLPPNAWHEDTAFTVFEAIVFGEEKG